MNTEAKVGAITLAGLMLLAGMIVYLTGISFGEKGYPVQAVFNQVNGLKPGNLVRYAGVEIGTVADVRVLPEGVSAHIMLNPGVKIPVGSKITIGSDGLLGEKFINIVPPREVNGFLAPNAQVLGENPQGLDELMVSANEVLAEVKILVAALNDVVGDEKVRAALKETALNTRAVTANLERLTATLAGMAETNQVEVAAMVSNLKDMSVSLNSTAARVDKMLADVDNNGQTAEDLRETIAAFRQTSSRVERMAAALEGVVTDPDTASNLKDTLKNARDATSKANQMLTKVADIKTEASVEAIYNPDKHEYQSNANFTINTSPRDFAVIGVTDIGEANKVNLQVGKSGSGFDQRIGLIESKAGVGMDAKLGSQLRMSLDVYDPNDVRVKLRTQYEVAPDTFLVGQTSNINKSDEKTSYYGVRRAF
ncbi:ABC-type transport system involved in resistance to organic solvents periplasmic component [uncultured Sporomusa sp.]|uniref:ABC-type transport system involved in resistance to organic solvents periplasmic component n=1 Tax=uncultured Sporomusa sp. TaxID=307249 RepID=A0A212M1M9_9FIRM|nr:MlaD family protein [uncultured Sporomusa sp.]SCM83569.1 ABC-type transport system involved in resistance to organic solvents periplasmic component [uncultured Sporomusa sp.]